MTLLYGTVPYRTVRYHIGHYRRLYRTGAGTNTARYGLVWYGTCMYNTGTLWYHIVPYRWHGTIPHTVRNRYVQVCTGRKHRSTPAT